MTKDEIQKMIDTSTNALSKELAAVKADLEKYKTKFNDYKATVSEALKTVKENGAQKGFRLAKEYCDEKITELEHRMPCWRDDDVE